MPAVIAPLAIYGSIQLFGGVLIASGLTALVAFFSWLRGWRRITVGPGEVAIEFPLRARRFHARDIVDVAVDVGSAEKHRWTGVDLYLSGDRRLRIDGCREGAVALYAALARAWQTAAAEGERAMQPRRSG